MSDTSSVNFDNEYQDLQGMDESFFNVNDQFTSASDELQQLLDAAAMNLPSEGQPANEHVQPGLSEWEQFIMLKAAAPICTRKGPPEDIFFPFTKGHKKLSMAQLQAKHSRTKRRA